MNIQKHGVNFNSYDIPLSHTLSKYAESKSFSLSITYQKDIIFFVRLIYLTKADRKERNINHKYELADLYLYEKYRGKKLNDKKYSVLCFEMVLKYIKSFTPIILWTPVSNIPAIKLYKNLTRLKSNNDKIAIFEITNPKE